MTENVEYRISLKDAGFSEGINKADDATKGLDGRVSGLGSTFTSFASIAAGALAGIGIAEFASSIVSTISEFEKYEAVLTNTLGSNSEAKKALDGITDFAAKTPYQVNELTSSFVKLANSGFIPTEKEMTNLGDLASSVAKPFDQLVEAVLDAQTGEFERLKEFGVKAKKEGENVSFTFKGQTQVVQNTQEAIKQYVLSLGAANGVAGGMAAISETTGGKISNLEDSIGALQLRIGRGLKPAISMVIEGLNGVVDIAKQSVEFLEENGDAIKAIGVAIVAGAAAWTVYTIATSGAAISNGLFTTTQWLLNAALSANPVGIVITAIGALAGGLYYAWEKSEQFRGGLLGVWEVLKDVGGAILAIGQALVMPSPENIMNAVKAFKGIDISKSFNVGYDKGTASFQKDQKEKEDHKQSASERARHEASQSPVKAKKEKAHKEHQTKAGITSRAPVNFHINIGSLVKDLNIKTESLNNMTFEQIRDMVGSVLVAAVNDSQRIAGVA